MRFKVAVDVPAYFQPGQHGPSKSCDMQSVRLSENLG